MCEENETLKAQMKNGGGGCGEGGGEGEGSSEGDTRLKAENTALQKSLQGMWKFLYMYIKTWTPKRVTYHDWISPEIVASSGSIQIQTLFQHPPTEQQRRTSTMHVHVDVYVCVSGRGMHYVPGLFTWSLLWWTLWSQYMLFWAWMHACICRDDSISLPVLVTYMYTQLHTLLPSVFMFCILFSTEG